jgi:hypothetical protein
MQMLVTKLPENRLSSSAIERYNTIIITGSVDLSESGLENIKRWIRNGGTLIASNGSAVAWASRNKLTNIQLVDVEQYKGENVVYDQLSNFQRGQSIPGGVFMSELELTHPMAFGYYKKELPTFRRGNVMMEASKNKFSNPGKYTKDPLLSGWINKPNLDALKETSTIRVNAMGQGRIISLADNPNFRAFWYGTNKLMMNAIFFGRIVNSSSAR